MNSKTRKKFSLVLLTVALTIVMALTFAACVKPKPTPEPPLTNAQALVHLKTISTALSNSISANLADGFYIGLTGAAKVGDENFALDLDANVLSKDAEGANANKNFRFSLKNGDKMVFGLYNDDSNLYLQSGENLYNFEHAGVMKALRMFLVQNVPAFNDLTSLDKIIISDDTDLKGLIKDLMPVALSILAADSTVADATSNLAVTVKDSTVSVKLFLKNLSGLLPDVDLSALNDIVIDLSVTTKTTAEVNYVKDIGLALNVAGTNYAISLQSKLDTGIFGEVKADLDAAVPENLKNTPASSIMQTDFAGKVNLLVAGADGNKVIKSFDWKLVSKMDLLTLVENNFVFSKLPKTNFFHFQLSHTCNTVCEKYCADNVVAAAHPFSPERYKNTSIIDIAWSPSTIGTNNIVADISLFDLITQRSLDFALKAITKDPTIQNASSMITMMVSSQLALNINPDAVVLKDDTVARIKDEVPPVDPTPVDPTPVDPTPEAPAPAAFDFMKLITELGGLVGLNGNALTVDMAKLKGIIEGIAGDTPIIGDVTVGGLIDIFLDTGLDHNVTDEAGVVKKEKTLLSAVSFTCDKSDFGHNAEVATYDTYRNAVAFNMNGTAKMAKPWFIYEGKLTEGMMNAYSGFDLMNGSVAGGSPALYTKGVTMISGCLKLFSYDETSKKYTLVSDNKKALTNDVLEALGGIKNLYFEYTYVDYNKEEHKAYSSVVGFQGLNLNTTGVQDVKLLTGALMGDGGVNTCLIKNLKSLLASIGVTGIDIPNLETIIPVPMDSFKCKINFDATITPPAVA